MAAVVRRSTHRPELFSVLLVALASGCGPQGRTRVDGSAGRAPDGGPVLRDAERGDSMDSGGDSMDSGGPDEISDVEEFPCDETTTPWRIVDPSGNGIGDAALAITRAADRVHQGSGALAFSYPIAPGRFPVLYNPVQTTELQSLALMLRSDTAAELVLSLTDRDGAIFVRPISVEAKRWTRIEVTPTELSLSPTSPVEKERIDPAALAVGFALFDTAPARPDAGGHNTLVVDAVTVQRAPLVNRARPWVIEGRTETITASTLIDGELTIRDGGVLRVSGPRLAIHGKIAIEGGGRLELEGTTVALRQAHRSQHPITVADGARLSIADAQLISAFPIDISGASGAEISLSRTTLALAGLHVDVAGGCKLDFDRVKRAGELVLARGARVSIRDSHLVLLWLFIEGEVTLDLPDGTVNDEWQADPALNIDLSISSSEHLLWGLLTLPGSELTLRDSEVLACGLVFTGEQAIAQTVRGLRNGQAYADLEGLVGDRRMVLQESSVATWNYYAMGRVQLTVEDSLFGEVLSFGEASVQVRDSHCDGSGGFVGGLGDSTLTLSDSTITADVTAFGRSRLTLERCQVTGDVSAADDSLIRLRETEVDGAVRAYGGRIE